MVVRLEMEEERKKKGINKNIREIPLRIVSSRRKKMTVRDGVNETRKKGS